MKQSLSTLHNFAGGLDIKQGRTSAKLRTGLHFNEVGTGNCVPIMLFTAGQIHKQERLCGKFLHRVRAACALRAHAVNLTS